ncbi:dTMP kinase [Halosimplex salinum]|uniref:dTMP kinase n=1 Tax=Halosimplex salinum TaxID=1710538 RepID=UPI000F45F532|nr:AAA family ATPase [Halosimplex salinum]
MTGTFVVLEGAAGTGKSTLLHALAEELRERGESVTTVPEFADCEVGEFMERTLSEYGGEAFDERALTLTASALGSLSYQAETVVRPALERGDVVLTERYLDSVAVYDTPLVAEREGVEMTETLAEFEAAMPVEPDLTVLLTIDEATSRDRFETHRPELLADGETRDRHTERQARFRDFVAGRENAVVYENTADVSTAVAEIAEKIPR